MNKFSPPIISISIITISIIISLLILISNSCLIGPEGPQGTQGRTGPQGPQGNVGPQGAQGKILVFLMEALHVLLQLLSSHREKNHKFF